MLTILPSLLLLFAAAAILILQRVRPGFGYSWMVGTIASLVTWGLTIAMRWINPPALQIRGWQPLPESSQAILLQWDASSWPYALALATLALAILLTLSARLQPNSDPRIWARNLIVIAIGMLAVLSANPLTFALTWTAIDIVELITLLGAAETASQRTSSIIAFGVRVAGTILLLWAMAVSASQGTAFTFSNLAPTAGLFVLISAGLRLGVLPLNLPQQQNIPLRRGIATVLRLVSAASSLIILARLPQNAIPGAWQIYLLAFTILAALYGAAMWAAARDEMEGIPFWIISVAALAVACVVLGQPQDSLVWGVALILVGSAIFLYNARSRRIVWIPALALISLSGLPFTLTASGWDGLLGTPINGNGMIFLIVLAVLMLGFIRHLMPPGEPLREKDPWIQTTYPTGLFIFVIIAWFIPAVNPIAKFSLGIWWAGPITLTIASLGFLLFYQTRWLRRDDSTPHWFNILTNRTGSLLAKFSSLNWLYQFIWWVYRQTAAGMLLLTTILEGDGGMLWVLVMLALLIALVNMGVGV